MTHLHKTGCTILHDPQNQVGRDIFTSIFNLNENEATAECRKECMVNSVHLHFTLMSPCALEYACYL